MSARIEALTLAGLGRLPSGELVRRVLPGEEIEVTEVGTARIIEPSSERVAPPCRHFKTCGGCSLQHASDAYVAGWKTGVLRQALAGQGLETEMREIATSPPQSRRRAKLSGRRTKKGALVGFHTPASDQITAIPDCTLLTPALMAGLPACEALTLLAASRKSEVSLTLTQSLEGLDILVEGGGDITSTILQEAAAIGSAHGLARLTWGDEVIVQRSPPAQQMGPARVVPPPGAFLQATDHGQATLVAEVREIIGSAARTVDLFSGCGTFALPLAERSEVHAVEGDAAMTAALDAGWRGTRGLKAVSVEARDLFRRPLLPGELKRFDAAVIDPPRAGAAAQIAELVKSTIPTIAMVSCNPVSFARDAKALCDAGYELKHVRPVDQFRWSAHVELVAAFHRKT